MRPLAPLRPYGASAPAVDPVSAVAAAVGAVFSSVTEIAGAVVGAKQARDAQIAAVAAVNPCVARVQAQIATLGPKPVWYVTKKQKEERDLRKKYEAQLRKLLADPNLCPEVRANRALQEAQEAANNKAQMAYITIGAVGLVGAGVLVYLARRKKS